MERSAKVPRWEIIFGVLILLGLPLPHVGATDHPVPFAQVTSRDSFMFTGMQGSLVTFQEVQSGVATHFGRVTWTANGTADPVTGAFSGTLTYVTASGDLAYGSFTGGFTGASSGLTGEGSLTFTGGTGRFQDLTGSAAFQTYTEATTGAVTLEAAGRIAY